MSKALTRDDLYSLEDYAPQRAGFRARVLEHKKDRAVRLGGNATLYFEDRLTVLYQVQEMLRVEKIFEAQGIEDELAAYNPLIPDGGNLKATFMIEYPEAAERRRQLARLVGIEDRVWMRVAGCEPVYAIADEDLERATEDKTSSVHFLRFEFDASMREAARGGAGLAAGIAHPHYTEVLDPLPDHIRAALLADFD